jgi:hypothetical protein
VLKKILTLFSVIPLEVSVQLCNKSQITLVLHVSCINLVILVIFVLIFGDWGCTGLHTNYNLMEELRGCKRAVGKTLPNAPNVRILGSVTSAISGNLECGKVI